MRDDSRVRLKDGERIDDLQRNGYGIIQNTGAFCFGMDAVLLSGFSRVRRGETVVDLCTGTGIVPVLLEAKTEGSFFYGVEIQPEMADMARRSLLLNDIGDKVRILEGDLREILPGSTSSGTGNAGCAAGSGIAHGELAELDALMGRTDVVTANPPYIREMHGLQNPEDALAIARHEVRCTLEDVCCAAARLLRSGGRFYMVHRPHRLPEIITVLKEARLEPKRLKFVHPYLDREANMVLIEAVRDGRPECRVEEPLVVYKEPNVYTDEIYDIYGY